MTRRIWRTTYAHDRRRGRMPPQHCGGWPRRRTDADAVQFAWLYAGDVGAADGGADERVPRDPLRPSRPWQIQRAARSLFDGAVRPGRAGDPRRARYREDALVRAVDGRHGRAMARRPCPAMFRAPRSVQYRLLLSRSD